MKAKTKRERKRKEEWKGKGTSQNKSRHEGNGKGKERGRKGKEGSPRDVLSKSRGPHLAGWEEQINQTHLQEKHTHTQTTKHPKSICK